MEKKWKASAAGTKKVGIQANGNQANRIVEGSLLKMRNGDGLEIVAIKRKLANSRTPNAFQIIVSCFKKRPLRKNNRAANNAVIPAIISMLKPKKVIFEKG